MGREGQGGTESDQGETSGLAGQGLCVFRLQAQALPLGVWTLGTTLSGSGNLSPPSVLFESFSARPPISLAHPSQQELEFAPKAQSCSQSLRQDEGRGLDFRSPWHPGDFIGLPQPPQTSPSKTKDVTSNPRHGGDKMSQAPEQNHIR